jgi:hypothetical protein
VFGTVSDIHMLLLIPIPVNPQVVAQRAQQARRADNMTKTKKQKSLPLSDRLQVGRGASHFQNTR